MWRKLDAQARAANKVSPSVGLVCSDESIVNLIRQATSEHLLLRSLELEHVASSGSPVVVVAQRSLDATCEAVARIRVSAGAVSLIACAFDAAPSAVERAAIAGAADFVQLPERLSELGYRARALLHRHAFDIGQHIDKAGTSTQVRGGSSAVELDSNLRLISVGTEQVTLTLLEFMILRYLQARPLIWVSAAEILAEVCGCRPDTDPTRVRVHVAALRRKLGSHHRFVESRRTYGYRWTNGDGNTQTV